MALYGLEYANQIREKMLQETLQNKRSVKIEILGKYSMAGQPVPAGMFEAVSAMHEMVALILHTRINERLPRQEGLEKRLQEELVLKESLLKRLAESEETNRQIFIEYEEKLKKEHQSTLREENILKINSSSAEVMSIRNELKNIQKEKDFLEETLDKRENELQKEREKCLQLKIKESQDFKEREILLNKVNLLQADLEHQLKEAEEKEALKVELHNSRFLLEKNKPKIDKLQSYFEDNEKKREKYDNMYKIMCSLKKTIDDIALSDAEDKEIVSVITDEERCQMKIRQLHKWKNFYKKQYEELKNKTERAESEASTESTFTKLQSLTQAAEHNARIAASAEEKLVAVKEDFEDTLQNLNSENDVMRGQIQNFKEKEKQHILETEALQHELSSLKQKLSEQLITKLPKNILIEDKSRSVLSSLEKCYARLFKTTNESINFIETKISKIEYFPRLFLKEREKLIGLLKNSWNEERNQFLVSIQVLERKINELKYDREQKEKQITELWAVKDDREELQERVNKLAVVEKLLAEEQRWKLNCEDKILGLQDSLDEALKDLAELRHLRDRNGETIIALEKEKRELLSKLDYMKELEVFEQNASMLTAQVETLNRSVSTLTQERDILLKSLNQASDQLAIMKKEHEDIENSLPKEVEALKALVAEREEELQTLQFQIQEKEMHTSHLNQMLQSSKSEARKSVSELKDSANHCKDLELRKRELLHEVDEKDKLISDLKNEIRDLQFLVKTDHDNKERLTHELKKKNADIIHLEKELQGMQEFVQEIKNQNAPETPAYEEDINTSSNEEEEPVVEELRETEQQEMDKAKKYSREKLLRKYLISVRQRLKLIQMVTYFQEEKDIESAPKEDGNFKENVLPLDEEQMAQLEEFVVTLQNQLETEQEKSNEIAERYNELLALYHEAEHKLQTTEKQIHDLKQKDRSGTIIMLRQKLSDAEKEVKKLHEQMNEYETHIQGLENYIGQRSELEDIEPEEYMGEDEEYKNEAEVNEEEHLEESLEIKPSLNKMHLSKNLEISQNLDKYAKEENFMLRSDNGKAKKLEAIRPRLDQKPK